MAASKTQSVPDGEELKTTSRRNGRLGFVNFGVFRSRVAGCDSTEARKQQKASRNSWQEAAVSLGLNTNPNCFHYTLNSIEANQAADNSFHSDHFRWPPLQRTLGKVGEEGKNYKRERERPSPTGSCYWQVRFANGLTTSHHKIHLAVLSLSSSSSSIFHSVQLYYFFFFFWHFFDWVVTSRGASPTWNIDLIFFTEPVSIRLVIQNSNISFLNNHQFHYNTNL